MLMELSEFKRAYADAVIAIRQAYMAALVASEVLEDFPRRLPDAIRTRVNTIAQQLANLLLVVQPMGTKVEIDDPFAASILDFGIHTALHSSSLHINFAPLLFSQCLVTMLAHLDGFLGESLKAACRVEPRLLRRGKQMTWERVLDAGSWDALMTRMTEEYGFEFGWKSVSDRLDHLRLELGISVETPPEEVAALEDAYQVRHILVHSGGRVSQEFLTRTQRTDVALGHLFTITADYAEATSNLIARVCGDIFVGIARKFFGAVHKDLTGIAMRRPPEQRSR
jgi:hypothetical protein